MSTKRALELERDEVLEKEEELGEEEMTWDDWFAKEVGGAKEVACLEDLRKLHKGGNWWWIREKDWLEWVEGRGGGETSVFR